MTVKVILKLRVQRHAVEPWAWFSILMHLVPVSPCLRFSIGKMRDILLFQTPDAPSGN